MRRALYKDTAEDPLGTRLYISAYRLTRHAEQILSDFDLTLHSYLVLYYVEKIPRVSIKELTEFLDVSQSIVSRSVQNLEQRKLLKRSVASDRRKNELSLSGEARKLLRKSSGKLHELSFILRHQPDFRISATEEQLDRIQKAVAVAKQRPLLRSDPSSEPGESVLVRLTKKTGIL
jgi:DNA-binding MarR family transcriptional regulator